MWELILEIDLKTKKVINFKQILKDGVLEKKMVGHSKFKNIMHRKGAQDKKEQSFSLD